MKRNSRTNTMACLGLALVAWLASAPVLNAQLSLDWFTIDSGGHTFSTGAGYALGGTCGQPDAGSTSGSTYTLHGGFWLGGAAPSVVPDTEDPLAVPNRLRLMAGLMNPFVDQTGVLCELPTSTRVEVSVFDHGGRLVRYLHDATLPPGQHRISWDGTDNFGRHLSSGAYLLLVRAGGEELRQRVVMLR